MANRYTEVLMTYVRRPFSSWQAAVVSLGGALWVGLSCLPGHSQLFSWLFGERLHHVKDHRTGYPPQDVSARVDRLAQQAIAVESAIPED